MTPTTTIRVSRETHRRLRALAHASGRPISEVLSAALQRYEDEVFWERVNAGYAALRDDAAAWAEVEAERRLYEHTLGDGGGSKPSA